MIPCLDTLQNGLRVIVEPRHGCDLVAVYLAIEVGSLHERAGQHGSAHFLEHMVFKGSQTRGMGQAVLEIESYGGDLNAWTSIEETVFHATLQSDGLETAIDVLADMVRNPVLDPGEIERERGVVFDEIRTYASDADHALEETIYATCYPSHAYGRPVIGTLAEVAALNREVLHAFWRLWGPSKSLLVVVGDCEVAQVRDLAVRHLGDWQDDLPTPLVRMPAGLSKPCYARVPHTFESTSTTVSWPTTPIDHPDAPALRVIAHALGYGPASLLASAARTQQSLVTDTWSSSLHHRLGGMLTLGFTPFPDRPDRALAVALKTAYTATHSGLDAERVWCAKAGLLADMDFALQTVDGAAHEWVWYASYYGSPKVRTRHRSHIESLTVDAVRAVARTYLVPDRQRVVSHVQLSDPTHKPLPNPASTPTSDTLVLSNGCTVMLRVTDAPVVGIALHVQGGDTLITPGIAGLPNAWAAAVLTGTHSVGPGRWQTEVDRLGGSIDAVADRDGVRILGAFPASAGLAGLGLTLTALLEPAFVEHEVHRIRDELLDDLRTLDDRPAQVADALCWHALWENHPWRIPKHGTPSSLGNLTPAKIRHWHQQHLAGPLTTVAVVGQFNPDKVRTLLSEQLGQLPGERPDRPNLPVPGPPPKRQHRAGTQPQAHAMMACLGPGLTDADWLPMLVVSAVLGSQSGRLFTELREKRGLAYDVWSQASAHSGGGIVQIGLATDPLRFEQATQALRETLHTLGTQPITQAEFDRARRVVRGHTAINLQPCTNEASHRARFQACGLSPDPSHLASQLSTLSINDIHRVASGLLNRPTTLVSVVPPE